MNAHGYVFMAEETMTRQQLLMKMVKVRRMPFMAMCATSTDRGYRFGQAVENDNIAMGVINHYC